MKDLFKSLGPLGKQYKKMMEELQKIEEQLSEERIEASAGGGMVKAVASGRGELLEIIISPEVVDPNDVEMLQDLVLAAVREALSEAEKRRAEVLSQFTGGIIPF
ncbi:YbaB/EbfC family nucleoid-associated protein [bacterium]|nr:YbaB/EbfC family nucleoid-associated protein [bacterium]